VLDSWVLTRPSEQTQWLEQQLEKYHTRRNKFAVYHVPTYPAFNRPSDDDIRNEMKREWCPIFDKYNLTIAWENHNHVFKKTVPIRNDTSSSTGTVYIGDGAW
jgi:hypothetical protein